MIKCWQLSSIVDEVVVVDSFGHHKIFAESSAAI